MATLEELRKQIDSSEQLQSVVKTMKTIAAVTIRQFEQAVESLRDYNRTVELGFQILMRARPPRTPMRREENPQRVGVIVLGSDQGMCGQFNDQIASYALEQLDALGFSRDQRFVAGSGQRVVSSLEAKGQPVGARFAVAGSTPGITPIVEDIVVAIESWREESKADRVLLFHNRPTSGSSYDPGMRQLFPLDIGWLGDLESRNWPGRSLPMFRMDWEALFQYLVRQFFFVALFQGFAESLAGENASRIASMQAAEKNIEEQLDRLQSRYRQERQRAITEELFDVISGFEALR
jgi:F-type H+-transporting ATPase subunit gamma